MVDYAELKQLQEERNDCLLAMLTHLKRFKILCEKMEVPSELLMEYGEFMIDWGNNMAKFGTLSKEQCVLYMEMLEEDER